MTNLKKNIDHYMELKGIKMYSHLLYAVALKLGIKGQDAYDFANREKANFSKMLKGERPLKYEYIIPLEKIFGVSLARMMDEDSYKFPVEKEMVPYIKGFRYYAYLDNKDLYEKELPTLLSKEGKSILHETDEFGKTFLDYVVEYKAVNGVRFLHDRYHLKLKSWNNNFDTEPKGMFWVHDKGIELARMIANMNDTQLFNDIYDPYYLFALSGYYLPVSIYTQDDFFEILLDHNNLFDSLFVEKEYLLKLGRAAQRKRGIESISFKVANPVLNGCLNYALSHLDKYKKQAIEILEFGIKHNQKLKTNITVPYGFVRMDEIGGIRDSNGDVIDLAIVVGQININDKEINELIKQLPRFNTF